MKVLDVTYTTWLILVTSYCLDLRQQNYTQDKAMEKMDEEISLLNEEVKILKSNEQQSDHKKEYKVEERKTELRDDSQKKENFGHTRNDRDRLGVPSFSFGDFHSRVGKEKSKRSYQRRNDHNTAMKSQRNNISHVKSEFLEQGYPFRKLLFQTNSSDKYETILSLDEISEANIDTKAKCFLIEENNLNSYEPEDDETMFKLSLNLMTDALPHKTSWTLFSLNNKNESIIDSMVEKITSSNLLLPNSLHNFEYKCYGAAEDKNKSKTFGSNKETCYYFEIYDSDDDGQDFVVHLD